MKNANRLWPLPQKGAAITEFLAALLILMLVLVGIFAVVGAELMSLRLSRYQGLLRDTAQSELSRLQTLNFDDPDLSTEGIHNVERLSPKGWKIILKWSVTVEDSGSERVTVKRIELVPEIKGKPHKAKTYVGRIYAYRFES